MPRRTPGTVDIVVIGRNEAALLHETLESVFVAVARFREEGNPEPMIVYVDGQSTDPSIDIARAMNIDVWVVPGIPTASKGRAIGAEACRGEYVMFLDGDTLLAPDWLLTAVPYLESHPSVAGVGGRLDWRMLRDGRVTATLDNYWNTRSDGERATDGIGGNFLYKRAILDQIGGWNRNLKCGEEFELNLRFAHAGYTLRRLTTPMGIHRDAKTEGPRGFLRRYLLTPLVLDAGRLTRSAPFSPRVFYLLLRRYWLYALHPMLVGVVAGSTIVAWRYRCLSVLLLALTAGCLLFLCHSVFKGFSVRRAIVSLITMNFLSLGWYVGLLLKPSVKRDDR